MQSFWRSLCGIESHVTSSKIMQLQSSNVLPTNFRTGLFTSKHNLSSYGRGTTTQFLQQPTSLNHGLVPMPLKCLSWTSSAVENKFHTCWELTAPQNGLLKSNMVGNHFSIRCLTTMDLPEKSDELENSAVSTDTVQPQHIKFKRLDKTAKHIMNILDKEAVEKVRASREIPDIKPGYIVQLKVEVPENKRRVSILKGIVIARRNAGLNTTFRLRRLVAGVGVESVFPLYSPSIKEMKVLDKKDVRRAKLYYLRDRMNALKK